MEYGVRTPRNGPEQATRPVGLNQPRRPPAIIDSRKFANHLAGCSFAKGDFFTVIGVIRYPHEAGQDEINAGRIVILGNHDLVTTVHLSGEQWRYGRPFKLS